MKEELTKLAYKVGGDTVAATRALTHAIALSCRSLQLLVEESDELNMPQLGSGPEAQAMAGAIEAMVGARSAQIGGRLALLRKAQSLGMPDFGEACPCGGAITEETAESLIAA